MSDLLDFAKESSYICNISESNLLNSLNDNFLTINSSKIVHHNRSRKFLIQKLPSLKKIEKYIHNYFKNLYYHDKDFYNIKVINDIINNLDTHLVAEFKDYLIMGDESEFLQKLYNRNECKKYLPTLLDYYKSCSIIFPNYVVLHESKYIFKNIRKKQKVIDNQQEQDEKKEKIKKGEIKIEDNNAFFTTNTFNSILSQTNTSYLKLFFGLNNNKNNNNDTEETLNDVFKKIVKAENDASQIAKKNLLSNKNIKTQSANEQLDKSKSLNNIKNNLKDKTFMNNCHKFSKNTNQKDKNKNIKNRNNSKNNKNNTNSNANSNMNTNTNNPTESNINILYSNRNQLQMPKHIIKLNSRRNQAKSNACIFETDANINLDKKTVILDRNNTKRKKIYKINNSNGKKINKNKKSEKLTNKEIISKIMSKIKNAKSAIFRDNNFFNTMNKNRLILNNKKHNIPKSISPDNNKISSNLKRRKNNSGLRIKINESYSTPNICNLKINRNNINNDKKESQKKKLEKEKNIKFKLLKDKSNMHISPLNKYIIINNSYKRNNNILNYQKTKNFISETIKNKITKKEKEISKIKIYKINKNSIAQRYTTLKSYKNKKEYSQSSNKATTISSLKNKNTSKFNSIKTNKNIRNINSKNRKTGTNNNININININSNNIFNSTNQINNSNNINNTNILHHNSNINNNLLNKKKGSELLRQSSFVSKKIGTHRKILKKMLLSASNNNIFNNSKKKYILEDNNKKKNSVLNTNNTLNFSGCLTSRNTQNSSKIKDKKDKNSKEKKRFGNIKSNISSYTIQKVLLSKKVKKGKNNYSKYIKIKKGK